MLTTFLFVAAAVTCAGIYIYQRADLRAAAIEARFPPRGEMVQVDGRNVHVIKLGSGPDLVLIHGAGGNAQDFTYRFADRISDRYRIFIIDRPGLGWTEEIDPAHARIFSTASASPAEQAHHLSSAVRKLGARDPIVVGHSYGGAVAMAWALNEPAAATVILSGATMPWPGKVDIFYRIFGSRLGGLIAAPLATAFVTDDKIAKFISALFSPLETPDDYLRGAAIPLAVRSETLRASARQVKSLRPHLVDMSAKYASISHPLEILHGSADTSAFASIHAEPLSRLVPGARLTILNGVGHSPHQIAPGDVEAAVDRAAARAGLR